MECEDEIDGQSTEYLTEEDYEFAEFVLEGNISIGALSPSGETALRIAVEENCIEAIDTLLKIYSEENNWFSKYNEDFSQACGLAIENSQYKVLIYLIKNMANLDYDHLLVLQLCYKYLKVKILKKIFKSGVNVNATSARQSVSLFHLATCNRNFDAKKYQLLIKMNEMLLPYWSTSSMMDEQVVDQPEEEKPSKKKMIKIKKKSRGCRDP
ncbi:hypothetical protein CHUAL_006298 [Chamberlinius hualienensis]